ncbi:MAG: exodeoxyribonuclease VII large subunit [Solirubrobacteraceae bacterium]
MEPTTAATPPPVAAQPAGSAGPTGSDLPGPYPVGAYAAQLKRRLREFAQVQLTGEVFGFRASRARVYFELRDVRGALPCSMWREDFDRVGVSLSDGMRIVVGGGCDYYPGSATSSPSFSFAARELRVAGEGDLLVALERLRRRLDAEGVFEPQKRLPRRALPRTIGVVCAERGKARDDVLAGLRHRSWCGRLVWAFPHTIDVSSPKRGKARDDVLAGLRRRGWCGRLVWAFTPVQDRHAAPRIASALRELAATPEVEVVIVARGGGSLADLYAFCDEALCRTVALLRVPVISSVSHHTDRTLSDDVAAVCCSTPTHAAEAAVPVDIAAAQASLHAVAHRLQDHGRRAVLDRAQTLARLSRAPAQHVVRHHTLLHQLLRELRVSALRQLARGQARADDHGQALRRAATRSVGSDQAQRLRDLERLSMALAAHDPQRTMARGYALVTDRTGTPLGSAAAARAARELELRFHDAAVAAVVAGDGPEPAR